MAPKTGGPRSVFLGLLLVLCLGLGALPQAVDASAKRAGAFLVPTGNQAGFGAFREGPHAAARLRRALGPPTEMKASAFGGCRMTWKRIGVAAELDAPGNAKDPCRAGTFAFARLTNPRWHTTSGVHPGGSRAEAEAASLLRCHADTPACGATGYALELYRDCSGHLFTGVLAHPRGNRIAALNVYGRRSCK